MLLLVLLLRILLFILLIIFAIPGEVFPLLRSVGDGGSAVAELLLSLNSFLWGMGGLSWEIVAVVVLPRSLLISFVGGDAIAGDSFSFSRSFSLGTVDEGVSLLSFVLEAEEEGLSSFVKLGLALLRYLLREEVESLFERTEGEE